MNVEHNGSNSGGVNIKETRNKILNVLEVSIMTSFELLSLKISVVEVIEYLTAPIYDCKGGYGAR